MNAAGREARSASESTVVERARNEVLEYLRLNPSLTDRQLAATLGHSLELIERVIEGLVGEGELRVTATGRRPAGPPPIAPRVFVASERRRP